MAGWENVSNLSENTSLSRYCYKKNKESLKKITIIQFNFSFSIFCIVFDINNKFQKVFFSQACTEALIKHSATCYKGIITRQELRVTIKLYEKIKNYTRLPTTIFPRFTGKVRIKEFKFWPKRNSDGMIMFI